MAMQSLKKIITNGLIVLALLVGMTASAVAAQQSFEEVKALAEKGDSSYQSYLGDYYSEGNGVRQDYTKAFYWYKKSADQGDASGQYNVGSAYSGGRGVRQDHSKALEWLKKSANQNNPFAQGYIGTMYEYGQSVRQNKITAKEWYGKSCDNGSQHGCDLYRQLNEQGY